MKDVGIDGRVLLKLLSRSEMGAWNIFVWLRVGTGGNILVMR